MSGKAEARLGFASRLSVYLRDGYAGKVIEEKRQPGILLTKKGGSIFVITSTAESAEGILAAARKLA